VSQLAEPFRIGPLFLMKVSFAIETAQLTIFLKSTNKNYMRVTAAFKFNVKLLVSITVGKNLEEYAS
jgi:hypothetical protein